MTLMRILSFFFSQNDDTPIHSIFHSFVHKIKEDEITHEIVLLIYSFFQFYHSAYYFLIDIFSLRFFSKFNILKNKTILFFKFRKSRFSLIVQ